jgi:hypothetical protein
VNLAVFRNYIHNIQREVNLPVAGLGVAQDIVNAGNLEIYGAEFEGQFNLTPSLRVSAQAGYTHGKYLDVYYDLNNDGVIDSKDYALKPPRLSPWSYGVSLRYNRTVANSDVTATFSFNHRDGSFYDDKNAGFLNAMDQIDAKLAVRPGNGHTTVSVYVKNALNRASYGGDTQLPDVAGFGGDGTGPRAAPPSRAVERPGDRRFDPVRVLIHPCRAAAPSCCRPAFAILRGAARDPTPLAQPLHHGGQDRTAPGPPTMPAMFRAAVAQGADRPAIHYFDTTYSFGDLDRLSDGLATALAEGGLPPATGWR